MTSLHQQVADYLAQNPSVMTIQIAEQLRQPEGHILAALPNQYVRLFPAQRAQEILTQISQWGNFTTIIEKEGSIFEIKDRFPDGRIGHGYYHLNLQGKEGALHGHLKLDNLAQIAFVSLPLRGKESYNIAFIAHSGQIMFKVYLGRDTQYRLFPEQVEKFKSFQ
ncbi:MAG: heme utilization cystosolic carrier protein HutX [[Pasteurella] mairii]|uniref:Heme iron utilization protein-like protein n=1 Tax=[Pasteurella] mairii TaxID=757 RepID=A0A379B5P7_9PAST|nr:heme utilization cystosolic carrier protein HutX [[Pasteurella] mairii]SUB33904.1 heme iron utilization protein-like protein [[Pasteurella] mairii]